MSQKRGIPHAHICICLHPSAKLRVGVNNQSTNDRIDQMIWGEIPVSCESKYRPRGWRTADSHRTSRWTEKVEISESDLHKREVLTEEDFVFDSGMDLEKEPEKKNPSFRISKRSENGIFWFHQPDYCLKLSGEATKIRLLAQRNTRRWRPGIDESDE